MEILAVICGFYLLIGLSWFFFTTKGKKAFRKVFSGTFISDTKLSLASAKTYLRERPDRSKSNESLISKCALCSSVSSAIKAYTVYTARIWGVRYKVGFKEYKTTTHYEDFEKHSFKVCRRCRILRAWIIPFVIFILIWIMLVYLFSEGQMYKLGIWSSTFIFALPATIFVIYKYLSLHRQLIRISIAGRKKKNPKKDFIGLTKLELDQIRSK